MSGCATTAPTVATTANASTPISVLAQVEHGDAPAFTPYAVADPGVALYDFMHNHGATMPPSWAQLADNERASICHAYATGYYDGLPTGEVDEFGVTLALAKSAIMTTVTDELMTSDQIHHVARYSPYAAADDQGAWVVSWLPLRLLTRNEAITAMTFAEAAGRPLQKLLPFLDNWANELDLTLDDALRLVGAS